MAIFDKSFIANSMGMPVTVASSQLHQGLQNVQNQTKPLDGVADQALSSIQMGLDQATSTLDPNIGRSEELSGMLQSLLMGNTPTSSLPGYNAMTMARKDAIGDLATNNAGMGKFFSGTTAEQAADIGGSMENQLLQQTIQNLMMGAQPGQQMGGQLAGMQMGAGTASAQVPLNIAQMQMQQNMANQQAQAATEANESGFWEDVLGGVATVGGALLASDVKLKENIKRIGSRNGHNWYQFTYKGSDKVYEGVMAHEVEKINPEAVVDMGNYKAVDYARL